jgi:hypothetical protein
MSESMIEIIIEGMVNRLDDRYMKNLITEKQYEREYKKITAWERVNRKKINKS